MDLNVDCHLELDANLKCAPGQPCTHTSEISALEEKIAKLKTQCQAEQDDELERAYLHNAIHDPLNRVPPEVASAILCCANPLPNEHDYTDGNPLYYITLDIKVPTRPLELASVCRRWRELALSEPRLWTEIVMVRKAPSWNLAQDLVDQWIARSGLLPLVIVLSWRPVEDPVDNEIIALIKRICALSHRWRSVVVRVPSAILPFFRCDTTIIQDIEHFTFHSTDDDGVGTLVLGKTIIRPTTVTLSGVWTPPANILWSNVTRLDMYSVFATAILNILTGCTRLNEMRLSFIPDNDENAHPEPIWVVNLSLLTQLSIDDIQEEHVETFFMHIRAPALRVLSLSRSKDDWEADAFSLTSFQRILVESEGSLVGLSLTGISFFNEDLITRLEPLASLRTLTLLYEEAGTNAVSDQLFDRLSASVTRTNGPSFLPNLVSLRYAGPRTFSWGSIARFAEAHNGCDAFMAGPRPSNKRPFSSLTITVQPQTLPDDFIDEEVLLRFMELPPTWMKTEVEGGLMEASFEHHGLPQPKFIFQHPLLHNLIGN